MARGSGEAVVVSGGAGELVLMWAGFPLLGAGLGAALTAASGWVADLPWFPFQGWFALLHRWPPERSYPVGAGVVALAGLVLALLGTRERLTVTVGRASVRLHRDGHGRDVARAGVTGVFHDGKALVLLDADGGELAREPSDLSGERLRAARGVHRAGLALGRAGPVRVGVPAVGRGPAGAAGRGGRAAAGPAAGGRRRPGRRGG
ncbi:hypothetical protein [Micromonospora sp. MA102]|uniref:YqeB family protein n=1 Tax=Micromonospora sp. MA102 TaxID=2952755 RepID=UPI0021C89B10|nr:hypothetical protein [Micromonospora sp. MA102]